MSDILNIEAWRPWDGVLIIHKGETFDPLLEWSDDTGAIDWTGYVAQCEIEGTSNAISLTTDNGGMELDAAGNMRFWMTDTDTTALDFSSGNFRLYIEEPGGKRRLFGRGKVKVD